MCVRFLFDLRFFYHKTTSVFQITFCDTILRIYYWLVPENHKFKKGKKGKTNLCLVNFSEMSWE